MSERQYPCFVLSEVGLFFFLDYAKFFSVVSADLLAYPVLQLMGKEDAKRLDVPFYDEVKLKPLSYSQILRMVREYNE